MLAVSWSTERVWGDRRLGGEDAADGGQHCTSGPSDGEHPAHADALGHGRLLIEGDSAHGDPEPGPVEEVHGHESGGRGHHGRDEAPVDQPVADLEPVGQPRDSDRAELDLDRVVVEHPEHDLPGQE